MPAVPVRAALAIGRAGGATTLLNPAPANAATTDALLGQCEVLVPNETEFVALLSRHAGVILAADEVAVTDDAALHALCRQLLPAGTVVVTLGAAGCFVSHPDGARRGDAVAHYRLAAEPAAAVDTTGAGDAFIGALAASLAGPDQAFRGHVAFANRYAALSTETAGAALAMPTLGAFAVRFPA